MMRKNKHGRIGVKRRIARPGQPTTMVEAHADGYRAGYTNGIDAGYQQALRDIGEQLFKRKLSSANMRKWFQEHLDPKAEAAARGG